MTGRPWDFDYRPIPACGSDPHGPCDVLLATRSGAPIERLREAFEAAGVDASIDVVLSLGPLHWARIRASIEVPNDRVEAIARAVCEVRYAASARHGSQAWAPSLDLAADAVARADGWAARARTWAEDRFEGGRWFLSAEAGGAAAIHEVTGTGAGARLAVIDDDAAGVEALDLDAEIHIGLDRRPTAHSHGASMVAWAVGAARAEPPFRGVAPDASPRLYLIPKPGADVVSLPVAIARAVADGADVIVCATYVEGTWSPMLDDALAFAERAGRGGLGAVVVLPTGRETSSPPGSVHASLTLSFGDPAADPRVLCVAPGARTGGWFYYRDRKKLARPFANRGPSVRLLAPGDDVAHPLGGPPRLSHAESSGASAIAAGVVALALTNNPTLRLREVLALLETTVTPVDAAPDPAWAPFADPHDSKPIARDRDGHDAKHGYGALSASRACLAASDPIAWALVRIGEDVAAARYAAMRRTERAVREAYSEGLARLLVRACLSDARTSHAVKAIVRHARLLSVDRRRSAAAPAGALAKQIALVLRGVIEGALAAPVPDALRVEIEERIRWLGRGATVEDPPEAQAIAERLFASDVLAGVCNGDDSA